MNIYAKCIIYEYNKRFGPTIYVPLLYEFSPANHDVWYT